MSGILLSKVNLRCKNDNALLRPVHGIIQHNSMRTISFFSCPDCPRCVKVVAEYSEEHDGMMITEVYEKHLGQDTFTAMHIDEQATKRLQEAEA